VVPCSRIVVATDEEWTHETPLAEDLSLAASMLGQFDVCRLGEGSWEMSPAALVGRRRDLVAEDVALDATCSVLLVPTRSAPLAEGEQCRA
jgi:hypothetical protein